MAFSKKYESRTKGLKINLQCSQKVHQAGKLTLWQVPLKILLCAILTSISCQSSKKKKKQHTLKPAITKSLQSVEQRYTSIN